MPGRPAALCAALALCACSAARPAPAPPPAAAPASAGDPTGARFFHVVSDETFWVTHAPDLDRVVAGGARLEVLPSGEVRAAAWDAGLAAQSESLAGGLAVPERLGGGFVFWSRAHVFRAREFTGEMEPLPLGLSSSVTVRGARAGLSSVLVLTNAGPRELLPGAGRLGPLREPALVDMAVLSPTRAARLDLFGRLGATNDGGAHWADLSPDVGLLAQRLALGQDDLFAYTWEGHFRLPPGGGAELLDTGRNVGTDYDSQRALETAWKNTRGTRREELTWPLHDVSPLALAVAAGAPVGDGTAFGTVQNAVLRVDLRTGEALQAHTDWIPNGVQCQPVSAPDGVLFACVWDKWQGYGGYVLRSVGGAPPVIEKSFSDDGGFFADDEGAIGYTGSCRAELRAVDLSARGSESSDNTVPPVFCVRRGPGEWAERRVNLALGETLVAWVPRRDGTATAIVVPDVPLPPLVGAPRATEEAGVRVLRLYKEVPGWALRRAWFLADRGGTASPVDRRFHAREDGSVEGWLAPSDDDGATVARGVTFDPTGVPTAHALPPGAQTTYAGGAFALVITRDGDLYESTDHGRTFQPAGRAPAPSTGVGGLACSALGCDLGTVVRLGWGVDPALSPRITAAPVPPAPPVPLPRLACTPRGAPVPIETPPPRPSRSRHPVRTDWGEMIEALDEGPPPPPVFPPSHTAPAPSAPPAAATASASAGPPPKPPKPARPAPAATQTQTLVYHTPLAPNAPLRRVATADSGVYSRRSFNVTALLAPGGDVDMLVRAEPNELLVAGDKVTILSAFDPRGYSRHASAEMTGLIVPAPGPAPGVRALLLGDGRRGLALEDLGPSPWRMPTFIGLAGEHSPRTLALARRDDGAPAVLVLDGPAPATAAAALFDRSAASVGPPSLLAPWSSVLTADDPRCKKHDGVAAYTALVVLQPATWLSVDPTALPGIELGASGLALVRWSSERVCLLGLDAQVEDPGHRRGGGSREWRVVVRWDEGKERGAVLRTADERQDLDCSLRAP